MMKNINNIFEIIQQQHAVGQAADVYVHGGFAAMNPGADFVQLLVQSPLAPEQGAGPVTAHRSIKLSFA
jgi:hypothetical protein